MESSCPSVELEVLWDPGNQVDVEQEGFQAVL